jgi:hypothetical protein
MNTIVNGIKTFTITSQPFYDQYKQCYKNIMMINIEPLGPLRRFVRRTKLPRLSPFQREGPCNPIPQCGLALQSLRGSNLGYIPNQYGISFRNSINYNSCCDLMTPDEIPDLISFLQSNGYQIETQITNMLNQSEIKLSNNRIAFTATYYGENQPNIVYMR